ncbi:hypothetical protein GH714_005810 [Hevea brasiliensis]|uniref:Glycosyltransferase N-terminal domain-containing protein n=1 Tax=Hevea brasiliensis TaxID=3981 RepID=A0A6A6NFP4_HEVBR|nr:hypothetical protein GH714_005810 [Hevea brasiliensis]
MRETQFKGHVVVLPYPSQGHINPLLQFAKRLASRGLKATLATTHYTVKSICAPNVTVEPISDGFDEAGFAQARNVDLYLKSFKANGSRTLSQLIQKFHNSSVPVNCIVYDSFLPWALDVAIQHGIYGAPFFTNSAAVCSIFCRIHHGLLTLPLELEDNKPLELPDLPPLYYSDLPTFLRLPESYPAYLAMKLSQFSNLDMADWIFANTFEELEGKEAGGISKLWPAKLIGPMVPSSYLDGRIEGDKGYGASLWNPLGEECLRWLETKATQSVVYVSFGSMVSLTTKCPMPSLWKMFGKWIRAKEDEKGVVRKQEVVRCLKEVMEGKKSYEIKKNARKWRQVAGKTVGEGGSSDKHINDFVARALGACK